MGGAFAQHLPLMQYFHYVYPNEAYYYTHTHAYMHPLHVLFIYLVGVPHPQLFKAHAATPNVGLHRQVIFAIGFGAALAAED